MRNHLLLGFLAAATIVIAEAEACGRKGCRCGAGYSASGYTVANAPASAPLASTVAAAPLAYTPAAFYTYAPAMAVAPMSVTSGGGSRQSGLTDTLILTLLPKILDKFGGGGGTPSQPPVDPSGLNKRLDKIESMLTTLESRLESRIVNNASNQEKMGAMLEKLQDDVAANAAGIEAVRALAVSNQTMTSSNKDVIDRIDKLLQKEFGDAPGAAANGANGVDADPVDDGGAADVPVDPDSEPITRRQLISFFKEDEFKGAMKAAFLDALDDDAVRAKVKAAAQ